MKRANPVMWAATAGILGLLIATLCQSIGQRMPGDPISFGMAGLFWGFVCASIRNRGLR